MNYKLYHLGGRVLLNYREHVKGNKEISKRLARRKLTRNVMLANKLGDNIDGKGTDKYQYGQLLIYVRGDKITKIKNVKHKQPHFDMDYIRYNELNELLEIDKYELLDKELAATKKGEKETQTIAEKPEPKFVKGNNMYSIYEAIKEIIPSNLSLKDVQFVCVGSDRSTGDALGPLVGSKLQSAGFTVYGTLNDPVHAMNLEETLQKLSTSKVIIAINAALGQPQNVGITSVRNYPVEPGKGVGREDLPKVGEYSIVSTVNVSGFMEYFVLQNTQLSKVMKMANDTAGALHMRFLDGINIHSVV